MEESISEIPFKLNPETWIHLTGNFGHINDPCFYEYKRI